MPSQRSILLFLTTLFIFVAATIIDEDAQPGVSTAHNRRLDTPPNTNTTLDTRTLPGCSVNCIRDQLSQKGCTQVNGTFSLNCICSLRNDTLLEVVKHCLSEQCHHILSPSFDPTSWSKDTCGNNSAHPYDSEAYDRHVAMVWRVRIVMLVVVPIFSFLAAVIFGIVMGYKIPNGIIIAMFCCVSFVVLLVVLCLGVILPLFITL